MNYFILIDPALTNAFLRLSDTSGSKDEFKSTTSSNFWSDLNLLIQKTGQAIQDIKFFINFGPGSYTGLKQSKILAEIFSGAGSSVSVFHQDHVLKANGMSYKYFFSSAYKNQYYVSQKTIDGEIHNQLMDKADWEKWINQHKDESKPIITIDIKYTQEEGFIHLTDIYKKITFKNLTEIAEPYADQQITYYRAVSDDYQISITR